MKLRGADIVARSLERAGVRYVFALSGNHVMPVFDALLDTGVRLVHVRHEAAAVHMADAWGRLTGEAGIALVTGGPGHANAVAALYTALAADSPLVLLSGHAPLAALGRGAFQEMRQAEMAAPVAKASWTAQSAATLGEDLARAVRTAREGRPGPVHLSLPNDVLDEVIDTPLPAWEAFVPATPRADPAVREEALDRLAAASRPLMIAGPRMACARGRALLRQFEEMTGVPALVMESPRGVNDPALGLVAEVLSSADVAVLVGKQRDFTLRFGQAFAAGCRVYDALADFDGWIAAAAERQWQRSGWLGEAKAAIAHRPSAWSAISSRDEGPLHPLEVARPVQKLLDAPDAVLVADGGEFGQWAQATLCAPHRLINGPAGSIGSALPFAAAAKLASPDARVVVLLGDGTFGFHAAEIDTAVRHGLGYLAIVGNDARWNAEHQIQLRAYGAARALGCDLLPTRYDRVAEGFGAHGEHVCRAAELDAAIGRAAAAGRVACVNVLVDGAPAPTFRRPAA